MNKVKKATFLCIAVLAVLAVTSLINGQCPHKKSSSCAMMIEGASVDINKIEGGIRINITGDTPEVVKAIQDAADEHAKAFEEGKKLECTKCKEGKECHYACPCKVEGAVMKVTKNENGVAIDITAEKAEAIAEIQKRADDMSKSKEEPVQR
ncbi:MAG: hypothetical protein A2Y62_10100 [Candidatus Fischerbacteria bacterium RBG_13_37_8]|uniref:Uncharacterized protein n=1 Tax=Candidatus Fischerbacteria bacterium RBG_13_37_8 TaxID=1817863 RepID=A0A1F5V5Y3_9BACT|nr:MAG: hypothetical protein A2Y62_10100 [Candidatus Fischerbacteria bacterium RBG_13_37_8]